MIGDISRLSIAHIYRFCSSLFSSELINVTHVLGLLELISVREGTLWLAEFDDVVVRQFIESIYPD